MYIYGEKQGKMTGTFNPAICNATHRYLEHLDNCLTLQFFQKNARSAREKIQIERELEIGRRKMKYWKDQPHFVLSEAQEGTTKLKAKWAGKL